MKPPRVWLSRAFAAVRPSRAECELDDEIAGHLGEATDEFIRQGLSPDEARLAALRSFGGVTQARQVYRDAASFMWLDDFRQDLRHSGRRLIKSPGFTLIAVLTLALGIGANTTIFTLLDAVVFKPLPVTEAHELVTFYEHGPEGAPDPAGGTGRFLRFSYPRFERLQRALGSQGSIAAVTRANRFVYRLPGATEAHFLQGQLVSGTYFATLGVAAARGRVITPDDVRLDQVSAVAVVSDGFWKRVLGATDAAIGQTITINGAAATIVGVAPPGFFGIWTDSEADVWLPATLQLALHYQNNSSTYATIDNARSWVEQDAVAWLNLFARVPAAGRARAISAMQAANLQGVTELASRFENPDSRSGMLAHTLVVEPFANGFSGLRARYADALFALTALVALVLLVTCANIANLLLTRTAGQARDLGIRISLGAGTGRLVRQCLTESLVLALLGGASGLLFGEWASHVLAREVLGTSGDLPFVFAPDRRVMLFALTVSLVTAVAFGLAPAFRAIALGRSATPNLNQRQAIGRAPTAGMGSLVIGQLALSVVIVFAATLFGRTLVNLMRIDPGFSTDRLVTASFDTFTSGYKLDRMPALGRRLLEIAGAVPGVTSVAVSRCGLVAGCSSSSGFSIDGAGERISLNWNLISPAYFRTAGIPLVSGREFDERDVEHGVAVAIVNESVARKYLAARDPVGQRLGFNRANDTEIVGVVRDARTQSLHDPPVPMVYFPIEQRAALQAPLTNLDVRVDGDPARVTPALREALKQGEPNLLFGNVAPMSVRLARDLSRERIVAVLASSFGALTLLLASLGLYRVLSYGVARRTQEIGVRMALGARRSEVLLIVIGQSARLTAAGIVLGLVATALGARYLSGMLFGITPLDPLTFVAVPMAFIVVTMLASYLPARRATRVDPIVALRCD